MSHTITVSHAEIARILTRKPIALILTRERRPGRYDLLDALTGERNRAHMKNGRPDLQSDPLAFSIEIDSVRTVPLLELDLLQVRSAGHRTVEEFHADWLGPAAESMSEAVRQRRFARIVFVHGFRIAEERRFLHRQLHKAYTTDPREAVRGEHVEALTREEQEHYSQLARVKDAKRMADPLWKHREAIAREISAMQGLLPGRSGGLRDTVRRLERELRVLDRKLAA